MDKIERLEQELTLNKERLLHKKEISSFEYRELLIQRSNIKDLLLEEYRRQYVSSSHSD